MNKNIKSHTKDICTITNQEYVFLFCCDPFDKNKPDMDYIEEYHCAMEQGYSCILFSHDDIVLEDKLVLKEADSPTKAIYRGWMLTPIQYASLYKKLVDHGYYLINSPAQYKKAHYLPEWYDLVREFTPKSVWTTDIMKDQMIKDLLKDFDNSPVIVKDFVKSRKHEWFESCYIPQADHTEVALLIIRNFITNQAEFLNEGIVLREFIELKENGLHPISKMPLSDEYRLFIWNNEIICTIGYWDGTMQESLLSEWEPILQKLYDLDSHFFTVDLAKDRNENWHIIEIGDGQVSGLQDFDPKFFYKSLCDILLTKANK